LDTRPELSRYLKHGHKFVSGWLFPGAVKLLVALAKAQEEWGIEGNVLEIGVHHGKLFILLSLFSRDGEKAVAVDLFADQARNIDQSGSGDLEKFEKNVKQHSDYSRVVIHSGDSTELTSSTVIGLGGGPFRFISVDGGHTPEIAAHDLSTAEGALAPGGVIILDDCFNEFWPGVSDGVHDYFSNTKRTIVPFATGGNKTFFCGAEFAARYIEAIRTVPTKIAMHSFLNRRILCCDFKPLTLHERVGQNALWRSLRDYGAVKIARGAYHYMRAVMGR
jgi:predicted O-methyltransferase YrrM